jgi:hypothetical protein
MPTEAWFAPPTGRNLVGGNQRLQWPVTPEFETLVPTNHPRVTQPSMRPRYIDPIQSLIPPHPSPVLGWVIFPCLGANGPRANRLPLAAAAVDAYLPLPPATAPVGAYSPYP